jgi:hypothetical protein
VICMHRSLTVAIVSPSDASCIAQHALVTYHWHTT